MLENWKLKTEKIGYAPGSLVYLGTEEEEEASFDLIQYNESSCEEKVIDTLDDLESLLTTDAITWLNVKGLHDLKTISTLGKIFNINSLTLEDILNPLNYPKIEFFDNYVFILLKEIQSDLKSENLFIKHVPILLLDKVVISLQDDDEDKFRTVKNRLVNNSNFKKKEADYLTYALVDLIVDHHFETLNIIGKKIEKLEDKLLTNPESKDLLKINNLKSNIIFLRSIFRPFKNVIQMLEITDSRFINDYMNVFLRDVNDHITQLSETVDIYRETVYHMMDIYLNSANNKMSEVMKTLTIIATIFIPLTFLAGIYGMNFKYMPELGWKYGYYDLLCVMGVILVIMLIYFREKKWL